MTVVEDQESLKASLEANDLEARTEYRQFVKDFYDLPESDFLMVLNTPSRAPWINALVTRNFDYRGQNFEVNDRVRIDMGTFDFVIEGSIKTKRRGQVLAQLEVADYVNLAEDQDALGSAYQEWDSASNMTSRKELAKQIGIMLIGRYVVDNPKSQFVGAKTLTIIKLSSSNYSQINFTYKVDDQPEATAAFYVRFGFDIALAV